MNMNKRKQMGNSLQRTNSEVIFPVAVNRKEMPKDYDGFITEIIADIKQQKIKTFLNANADMVCLYWRIGQRVLENKIATAGEQKLSIVYRQT